MAQQDYLTQAITYILNLVTNLVDKRNTLSVHHYKQVLNEIYLKYFGCDRRAVNTFKVNYFLDNCCSQENFHPQKGLLLIWLYLEEATLSRTDREQLRLINNATVLYRALSELLPDQTIDLIKSELQIQLKPVFSSLASS